MDWSQFDLAMTDSRYLTPEAIAEAWQIDLGLVVRVKEFAESQRPGGAGFSLPARKNVRLCRNEGMQMILLSAGFPGYFVGPFSSILLL
jgi:hypothetical protein